MVKNTVVINLTETKNTQTILDSKAYHSINNHNTYKKKALI